LISGLAGRFLDTDTAKAVVVALDHGMVLGATQGFENPGATLRAVLDGEPDGVLAGPGFVRHFRHELEASSARIIVRSDLAPTSTIPGERGTDELQDQILDMEQAVELGASGLIAFLVFGRTDASVFMKNVTYLGRLSMQSQRYGIPLIIEPVLWGGRIPAAKKADAALIEHGCRIAFELGADALKAPYTGDTASFTRIASNIPIPILVLGGPRMDQPQQVLQTVAGAMAAGAHGVFFGRNIFQYPAPSVMIRAIKCIVHEGAAVSDALRILSGKDS